MLRGDVRQRQALSGVHVLRGSEHKLPTYSLLVLSRGHARQGFQLLQTHRQLHFWYAQAG
eukprot:COSAG02_NODE_61456_length_268_cov_0.923077_1_plen_59_part_01